MTPRPLLAATLGPRWARGCPAGMRLLPSDGWDLPGTVPGSHPACVSNDDFIIFFSWFMLPFGALLLNRRDARGGGTRAKGPRGVTTSLLPLTI